MTEEELEQVIQHLEYQKQEEERAAKKTNGDLDRQLQILKDESAINEAKLRDRDQDLKLTELRLKDLKRQIQIMQQNAKDKKQ